MSETRRRLLDYYKRELAYLRKMGAEFARLYPKIAGRLELGPDDCHDPHIERLLESFAFLTARIQYDMESELPRIATALLEILFPQFAAPIPSMTIACFEVDPTQGKLTSGHVIAEGTGVFAETREGEVCRFQTRYPVELWPVAVEDADFVPTDQFGFLDHMPRVASVLRLRVASLYDGFGELDLRRLRFYINTDPVSSDVVYELVFAHLIDVALLPEGAPRPVLLSPEALRPVGFGQEEGVLPYPPQAHYGYRLLHEYFSLPEKFLFLDVERLDRLRDVATPNARYVDILFLLDQGPKGRLTLEADMFRLGCTPVINLFRKTSEPIRLDHTQSEYRISPDARREAITEIHSISSVSASSDAREVSRSVMPFFSYTHDMARNGHRAFWTARRQDTGRADLPGTEMFLSFVDLDFQPRLPATDIVFVHAWCSNRYLASEMPSHAVLQIEEAAPLARIFTLRKPTPQISPPLEGEGLWRLISHLSVNYLSLSHPGDSLKALREILRLYNFSGDVGMEQQVTGIRDMTCRPVVRRVSEEAWRGFCKGVEISLTLDERLYVGSSAFLLAAVLNRFFPLYTSLNGFTQVVLHSLQREGIWKQWPPVAGEQILH